MKRLLLLGALATCLTGLLAGAEIPRPAPDVTIGLPGGKQLKVSDYRGKVVVLTFILTT